MKIYNRFEPMVIMSCFFKIIERNVICGFDFRLLWLLCCFTKEEARQLPRDPHRDLTSTQAASPRWNGQTPLPRATL